MTLAFIPNESDATYTDQAEPDSVDLAAITDRRTGVITGCAVTINTGTYAGGSTCQSSAGVVIIGGREVVVGADTTINVTAPDGSNPRVDLVVVDTAGAVTVTAGTAAANPVMPAYDPTTECMLAAVYVNTSDAALANNEISDKRILVNHPGFHDVKAYGAVGDNSTDDTTAIQAAHDAAVASDYSGTVYFPEGTYLTDLLNWNVSGDTNVTWRGQGSRAAVLKHRAAGPSTRIVDIDNDSNAHFMDLGFDGAQTAGISGIYNNGNQTFRVRVERCRFIDFYNGTDGSGDTWGIRLWNPRTGVTIVDNEFVDCVHPIRISYNTTVTDGYGIIARNIIRGTSNQIARRGIYIYRTNPANGVGFTTPYVITGNVIRDVQYDTGPVGGETGHAISILHCKAVTVTGNTIVECAQGVVISDGSYGCVVMGNAIHDIRDQGGGHDGNPIRVEPEIGDQITGLGSTGEDRGVVVIGNACFNCEGAFAISYAAGSTIIGNIITNNQNHGINCDSDAVTFVGNVIGNSWNGNTTANPSQGGVRANLSLHTSDNVTVVGNVMYDSQATPTIESDIAISSTGTANRIEANRLLSVTDEPIHLDNAGSWVDMGVREISGTVTLDHTHSVVNVDTSGGAATLTLPDNAKFEGKAYTIRRDGASSVTINRAGTDTFDDAATSKTLGSDGAAIGILSIGDGEWKIVGTSGTVT